MGWHWPEHIVHDFQHIAQHYVPEAISGFGGWLAKTVVEAILGLICGLFLLPIVARVIAPVLSRFTGSSAH
jgi:predicted DNA repair protein MutK